MIQAQVVIVGAGAAGLQCAASLLPTVDNVVILEARNRIGGRVYTSSVDAIAHYDQGAAWVHGTGHKWGEPLDKETAVPCPNPMVDLLLSTTKNNNHHDVYKNHLRPVFHGNPWMRPKAVLHGENQIVLYVNGVELNKDSPVINAALHKHFEILEQVSEYGNQLYHTGKGMETTKLGLQDAMQRTQRHNKRMFGLSEKDRKLATALTPFYTHLIECWYGAPVSELQLCEFIEAEDGYDDSKDEWDTQYCGEGDYFGPHCTMQQGMETILQPLLENGVRERIHLNKEVTLISKLDDGNGVMVETACGMKVTALQCVVTLPAGCLKDAVFEKDMFNPPLSQEKMDSIKRLRMGTYKKVLLTFDRIFWPVEENFLGLVLADESKGAARYPIGNYLLIDNLWARDGIPCFEALLFGASGSWAAHKTEEQIRNTVLDFIRDAMGLGDDIRSWCIASHVTRWEEDPYSKGAYSSMALGSLERHVEELRRPEWDGTLVFAGEATISEFEGSVHAALLSGQNAAKAIVEASTLYV